MILTAESGHQASRSIYARKTNLWVSDPGTRWNLIYWAQVELQKGDALLVFADAQVESPYRETNVLLGTYITAVRSQNPVALLPDRQNGFPTVPNDLYGQDTLDMSTRYVVARALGSNITPGNHYAVVTRMGTFLAPESGTWYFHFVGMGASSDIPADGWLNVGDGPPSLRVVKVGTRPVG